MTQWLYLFESYQRDFEAGVTQVTSAGVVLTQSVFYPGGGGQPSDQGELLCEDGRHIRVSGLKREKGRVVHLIDQPDALAIGMRVRGQLDWDRRFQLMRTHSAMNILCGVIWRDYAAHVTGANMTPCKGRLDFDLDHLTATFLAEIQTKVNLEVAAERDILIHSLSRDAALAMPDLIRTQVNWLPAYIQEIRTVDIVGLDLQADAGTHVANTGEVGQISLPKWQNKGKNNQRLYLELNP